MIYFGIGKEGVKYLLTSSSFAGIYLIFVQHFLLSSLIL